MNSTEQEKQVISKKRVADHGEVLTGQREVNAMLDLVKQETERIESRFLEPACGTGNFLAEVLDRKLHVVETRYGKSQLDYERNAIVAISSIYGIDILEDNVMECRKRLFNIFNQNYARLFETQAKQECCRAAQYILKKNIIWGNALNLETADKSPQPIVFSEWSPVNSSMLKRRDFCFSHLLAHGKKTENRSQLCFSDLGEDVFIPEPVKEYPLTYFLKVADVEK